METNGLSKMEERLRQTVEILKKITGDLGIPYSSPEVQELKGCLNTFVRTGEPWSGEVDFSRWGRRAVVNLTRAGAVEVTLRPTVEFRKMLRDIRQPKSQ